MAKYSVTERKNCRICGSDEVVCYLTFADMPFTDDFLRKDQTGGEFLWPIKVFYCPRCHVSQTLHDVDVKDYYRQYQYTVATSGFAQQFMRRLAEETWKTYGFKPGDRVIEVGSSDGVQLAYFKNLGAEVFGFEPSAPLAEMSRGRGVPVAMRLFDSTGIEHIPKALLPVQAILLTYTFDHLPNPMHFLADVRKVLDPRRGVLVIEVHDLEKIFARNEYCLLQHEHTIYCTDATLQGVLARGGFRMISKTLLPEKERRGNSLLIAATPEGSELATQALPPLAMGPFGHPQHHVEFGQTSQDKLDRFRRALHARVGQGKTLAGYGAGGRGVMVMAQAGLDNHVIRYLCDQNTAFHGLVTPRSHVPIVGPQQAMADPVDEVVVFSFGYMDEIRRELAPYTAKGGRLTSFLDLLR